MREPRNYGALRETAHQVDAGRGPGDQQEQKQDAPFLTEMEKHEAARDAKIRELDAKVQAGQISRHEMSYRLSRFENDVSPAQKKPEQEQPTKQPQARELVFSEDRERPAAGARSDRQANRDEAQDQSKAQGDGRALRFFEDRSPTQGQDRGR